MPISRGVRRVQQQSRVRRRHRRRRVADAEDRAARRHPRGPGAGGRRAVSSTKLSIELGQLDATGQAELVRGGEVSAVELVDAAIERIESLNPTINAVVTTACESVRD